MPDDRLLAAAREVLHADPSASVARIAAAAGISRATFYRRFPSREALRRVLDIDPGPGPRERLVAAALDLVSRDGLGRLSMEELSAAAGVSRATLYRLFPGKAALFGELVRRYSPLEAVNGVLAARAHEPPEAVLPAVAEAAARAVSARVGVVRTLVFELTAGTPDSAEAAATMLGAVVGRLAAYLAEQMERGRLRRLDPVLALQSFIGPILLHSLSRTLLAGTAAVEMPLEQAAATLAAVWVQGMRVPRAP